MWYVYKKIIKIDYYHIASYHITIFFTQNVVMREQILLSAVTSSNKYQNINKEMCPISIYHYVANVKSHVKLSNSVKLTVLLLSITSDKTL